MSKSAVEQIFLGIAIDIALVSVGGGVLYRLGHFSVDGGGTAKRIGVDITLTSGGLAILSGLFPSRRSEGRGAGHIAVGALPPAI